MPFPNIDPVLVHIGPIAIRWYALAYIASILLGWRYMVGMLQDRRLWLNRPPPMSAERMDDLILWLTAGIILGGRLGHVLFYTPELIWKNPIEILRVWNGGMSFHGGALGVLVAGWLFARRNGVDPLRLGDLVVVAEPIGGFFVRIANFINGELWGRPTQVPWGMVFCNRQIITSYGFCPAGSVPRHPSPLYEAALEGLLMLAVLWWATHGPKKLFNRRGVVMGIFLTGYAVIRMSLENVRQPDAGLDHLPYGLTMGMMLSAPMLLAGVVLIWRGLREPLPPAMAEPSAAESAVSHEPA